MHPRRCGTDQGDSWTIGLSTLMVIMASTLTNGRPHEIGSHDMIGGDGFLPDTPHVPMPQLLEMDVQCSKKSMVVRLRFDRPFQGLIYSKGHYGDPACRYLAPGSSVSAYEFTVHLDRCGTVFIEGPPNAYLENTIILQNEARVLEIWDSARKVRCQWTGQVARTVTSALGVDMLDSVAVTYSGDAAEAHLDVQLGKGPYAAPVNGLVKIGETLTAVITVQSEEGGDLDVQVKDCVAHDGDPRQALQLTDSRGCVLKKKLMGPWQKTKNNGNLIAFAYLQAFKFPDKMEVFLECNVEICKFQCPAAPCGKDQHSSETKNRASVLDETQENKTRRRRKTGQVEEEAWDSRVAAAGRITIGEFREGDSWGSNMIEEADGRKMKNLREYREDSSSNSEDGDKMTLRRELLHPKDSESWVSKFQDSNSSRQVRHLKIQSRTSVLQDPNTRRRRTSGEDDLETVIEEPSTRWRRKAGQEEVRLQKGIRVVAPDDLPAVSLATSPTPAPGIGKDDICMSMSGFIATLVAALIVALASAIMTAALCSAKGRSPPSRKSILR